MLPAFEKKFRSRYFASFHQDKDKDLEGEDEDNPLVIAGIRSIVCAFKSVPSRVILVHYAFHVRLVQILLG